MPMCYMVEYLYDALDILIENRVQTAKFVHPPIYWIYSLSCLYLFIPAFLPKWQPKQWLYYCFNVECISLNSTV